MNFNDTATNPTGAAPVAVSPEDVQATFCATLVDEWVRAGVVHFVVSPGSRSTPLALAIAADQRAQLRVVLDERSAAFVAIGIARATSRCAVLLCTSGTAAVEFHAAVVEADLDHVPLIVCTADRPPELHGIGAAQTVVQQGLYGGSTRWACDPGVPSAATMSTWRSISSRCVLAAETSVRGPGPVHLNLAFREPLVGVVAALPASRPEGRGWHVGRGRKTHLSAVEIEAMATYLSGRRGVLVVGALGGDPDAVHSLAWRLGWPVLADMRSGSRIESQHTIAFADLILRDVDVARQLRPDVVLRLGAPWASKVVGQWLADVADDVLVDPFDSWLDPNRACAVHITTDPSSLCHRLSECDTLQPAPEGWLATWRGLDDLAGPAVTQTLDTNANGPLLEPVVARTLYSTLAPDAHLVVSSSMPVRDLEWFGELRTGVTVHANRGANGIDGVVSTVLGVAIGAANSPVVGLLGDLAFLHDASGLVTASSLGIGVTFVVVDNGGGGIFEFLPQAQRLDRGAFELLFGTGQNVDIVALSQALGFDAIEVSGREELAAALRVVPVGPRVIVIRTDRVANVGVHNEIYAAVSRAMATRGAAENA